VADTCEYNNELLFSIEGGVFLDQIGDYQFPWIYPENLKSIVTSKTVQKLHIFQHDSMLNNHHRCYSIVK
jgi:hypothetical protein